MLTWSDIGFRENPYHTRAIRADEADAPLLVGRRDELDDLMHSVTEGAAHVTIDGDYGVGKTSLCRVLAVELDRARRTWERPPHYPLLRSVELQGPTTAIELASAAYLEIAQTLIHHRSELAPGEASSRLDDLGRLLNEPVFRSYGGGGTVLGIGGSGSRTVSPSSTFLETGLPALIADILAEHFPERANGGLVVTLENVELAGSSVEVKALLHGVRDQLLHARGLRWVFTGAGDGLRQASSSGPLGGVLGYPMTLAPIGPEHAEAIIARRLEVYQAREDAQPPVDGGGLATLIGVARGNLRYAFDYASSFSAWALRERVLASDPGERLRDLGAWMARLAETRLKQLAPLDLAAWRLFDAFTATVEELGIDRIHDLGTQPAEDLEARGLIERRARPDGEVYVLTLLGALIGELPSDRRV